jgi:asparagine synthase (glutamine-hydrolysing)
MDYPSIWYKYIPARSPRVDCDAFGDELAASIAALLRDRGCDCVLFSGGIDTAFVAAAAVEAGIRPRLVTVELPGGVDARFAASAAEALGLELLRAPVDPDLVEECERRAISVTRSIDPVEIAADTAACLGLRAARDVGCGCAATGDGGDELFLGYPFLLGYDQRGVDRWYSRVLTGSRFASRDLGFALGIGVELPLYTDDARRIALETPLECKIGDVNGRRYGKLLMRRYLDRRGLGNIAWREKVPITEGSGAMGLIARWSSGVELRDAVELHRTTGIKFPSRAHVHLYRVMEGMCIERPGRCSDPRRTCPTCGSCMEGGFCRFCGTYVGDGGAVSHYSDGTWDELGREGAARISRSRRDGSCSEGIAHDFR